jgi:hypothetical protein
MTRADARRRLVPITSWLALLGIALGVSAAVGWVAGTIALAQLRPGAWEESLASALTADYRAAEAAERFVPVQPSIIDDIARDVIARSATSTSDVIAPIFVIGEGNRLPGDKPTPPQDAATSVPGTAGQPSPKPTNTPKPAQTPDAQPTPKPTNTPKPAQTPDAQLTPKPTNTPDPPPTPDAQLTPKPTNTPRPAPTPPTGQPTPPDGQPTPKPTSTPKPAPTPPAEQPPSRPTPPPP